MVKDRDLSAMVEILAKQQVLMSAVPHPLREDAHVRMLKAKALIEYLLVYLNSTGHKPWRPNPLPHEEQLKSLSKIGFALSDLQYLHEKYQTPSKVVNDTAGSRLLVSTFGGLEEIIEFYDSWERLIFDSTVSQGESEDDVLKEDRAHMLEELTDELFFFLERMILVGFSWEEVINEYHRKWEVNMKRYSDAKKGDYTWDKRGENKL